MSRKLCKLCNEREAPWFRGVCDYCFNLPMYPDTAKKYEEDYEEKSQEETGTEIQRERSPDSRMSPGEYFKVFLVILALIWFVVMLPAQPDFYGIVVGWIIIGGAYLLFRIFSR